MQWHQRQNILIICNKFWGCHNVWRPLKFGLKWAFPNDSSLHKVLTKQMESVILIKEFNKFVTNLTFEKTANGHQKLVVFGGNMIYKNAKLAAYMMVGVIAFSGSSIRAEATGVSSLLPAAGLALTLEEGSEQKEVKASTKSAEESPKKEEIVTSLKKDTESKDKKSDASTSATEKADDTKKTDGKKVDTKSSVLDGIKDENSKIEIKNSLETSKEQEKKEEKKPLLIEDKEVIVKDADTAKAAKVAEDEKLTEEEKEFSKLVIAKVNDYVNVRSGPGEDTEIIGKLYDESVGDFYFGKGRMVSD